MQCAKLRGFEDLVRRIKGFQLSGFWKSGHQAERFALAFFRVDGDLKANPDFVTIPELRMENNCEKCYYYTFLHFH